MRKALVILILLIFGTGLTLFLSGCTVTVNVQRYQDTDIVHPHELAPPRIETREIIKNVPGPTVVKKIPSPPKVIYRDKPYPVVTFPEVGELPKAPNLDDPSLDNSEKINDALVQYIKALKHYVKVRDDAGKKNIEASKH